ncbi:MAG: Uma2 family endonuclease [Desulfamplus sp.]|nr:Uma2 family endonuclease [Desulfamplus sp.]
MESTMALHAVEVRDKFTYADYLQFPGDQRWELIEGQPYDMSPAPGTEHQRISGNIFGILWVWSKHMDNGREPALKKEKCMVFAAPFDVRLPHTMAINGKDDISDSDVDTVVQPDIVVICDKNRIDNKGCIGPPDVVVEILSPSTAYKDTTEKLSIYEKHGVREYWIVNPQARYIMLYSLDRGAYGTPAYLKEGDLLVSTALSGLKLDVASLWQE